jgi:peptidoglycan hydrolase-like protein with peptidoglycan-binding domain
MRLAAALLAATFTLPALAADMPAIPLHPRRMDDALTRNQVEEVQKKLAAMGYEVGPMDGKLGPKTRAGLERFQREHGLTANGDLTERTLAAIEAAKANPTAGTSR